MRKILLDCGSHLGESVLKFSQLKSDIDSYDIYMFEPNPVLFDRIQSNPTFDKHTKYKLAISNKNEIAKLYGCTVNTLSVGSTLEKSKADFDNIGEQDYVEIGCLDLSKFILDSFNKSDYIVLKLDIEGAEYDVLDKLISTGIIEYIDELYCEFHTQWLAPEFQAREDKIREELNNIGLEINFWDAL